jgi:integrase
MNKSITVTIECRSSNILRLRWKDGDARKGFSLGIPNMPPNKALAITWKRLLESDLANGEYDPTHKRYLPQVLGSQSTDITAPDLFDRFKAHKLREGDISEHTASVRYTTVYGWLKKHLNKPVSAIGRKEAEALCVEFGKSLSPTVAKYIIILLKACWDWGQDKYQTQANPWGNLNKRFKTIPKKVIEPFTKQEIKAIVKGFETHEKYNHYTESVRFQFGLATRPGEAIALTWDDIKPDFSSVWIGKSTTGEFQNPTTKTGKARHVLLPQGIATMLKARKEAINPGKGDYMFPDLDGGAIDCKVFLVHWRKVLAGAGVKYRKPYSTRHTAISHALLAGADPVNVAEQAGHDLATLFKSYVMCITKKQVFTEFD